MENRAKKISNSLKTLRREKNWNLEQASQKTGVSKAMLGQIERGESSPTIATLWKIADGFTVPFSFFIDDSEANNGVIIHRESKLKKIHPDDDRIRVMPLFAYDDMLQFEIFIIELLPGCEHLSQPHQKGTIEHIIVSSGQMEVLINNIWHKIAHNEGLRFAADQIHGYKNNNQENAVFQNIIYYKK